MSPGLVLLIIGVVAVAGVGLLVWGYGRSRKREGTATQQVEQSKADDAAAVRHNREMATRTGQLGARLRRSKEWRERERLRRGDK